MISPLLSMRQPTGRVGSVRKARILGAWLLACVMAPVVVQADEKPSQEAIEARIAHYAKAYGIPFALLHKVVRSESTFNPAARNGPYWGLMQIRPDTARGLGYAGSPEGLLDAETNLIYGGAYLANAYKIAGGNSQQAHNLYRKGYYYEAKRKRLLSKLIKIPMGMAPVMVAGETVARPAGQVPAAERLMVASNETPAPIPAEVAFAPETAPAAPMVKPVARPVLARAAIAEPPALAKTAVAALEELPLLPRRRPAASSKLTTLASIDKAPRGLLYAVPLKAPTRLVQAVTPAEMLARPELALASPTSAFADRATAAAIVPPSQRSAAARLPSAVRLAASHDGTLSEIPACCQMPSALGEATPLPRIRPGASRAD